MTVEEALDFIRQNFRAVAATYRSDGRPAMSPVGVVVDDANRVVLSTRETAMKVKHLRRDPRLAVCVFTDRFFGSWVQVEGQVEIVSLPEAMDDLVDYYRRAAGEHPDWDDYRQAMVDEQRCIVRFTVERAGPTQQG